jgi:hypothetical protein
VGLPCAVATFTEPGNTSQNFASVEVPVNPSSSELPILTESEEQEIAKQFQDRLLAYRFRNRSKVLSSTFDAQRFTLGVRELAQAFGRCAPDDPELQQELVHVLSAQDTEIRSGRWTDLNTILLEVILAGCHEAGRQYLYVGDIAKDVQALLEDRGERRQVEPREVGARLRGAGLVTEPRDSKGFRLRLSQLVRGQVHKLARSIAAPTIEARAVSCPDCRADGRTN